MGTSIVLRVWPRIGDASYGAERMVGATVDDLAQLLRELIQAVHTDRTASLKHLQSIEHSIAGDGESTIITQLQKLRTSMSDHMSSLSQSFSEFAQKMADNNSKALIEALEEVMRDFNTKINEQFGDNFKQLNEAVGRMLEWQQAYRHQIDEMSKQYQLALEGIERARDALTEIATQNKATLETVAAIGETSRRMSEEEQLLRRNVEAFAAMRTKAETALPAIEESLRKLVDGLNKNVDSVLSDLSSSVLRHQETVGKLIDGFSKIDEHVREEMRLLLDTYSRNIQELMKNIDINVQQHATTLHSAVERVGKDMERMNTDNAQRVARQVENLDKSLTIELDHCLKKLGNDLASLSDKFVHDYGPLTDKLREVVQLADSMKPK